MKAAVAEHQRADDQKIGEVEDDADREGRRVELSQDGPLSIPKVGPVDEVYERSSVVSPQLRLRPSIRAFSTIPVCRPEAACSPARGSRVSPKRDRHLSISFPDDATSILPKL